MSEDKLKDLWKEFNEPAENQNNFSEDQVRLMLTGKTGDIFSRIFRNLKIGMGLLGLYICVIIYGIYNLYFADDSMVQQIGISNIYIALDFCVDLAIIGSFIYFFVSFNKLRSAQIAGNNLKGVIKSAIKILISYRRFFYYIIAVTLASGIVGFIYGAKYGMAEAEKVMGEKITTNPDAELIFITVMILFGLIFFGILLFIVWLVFKKLYGNYIEKLHDCYDELIETE